MAEQIPSQPLPETPVGGTPEPKVSTHGGTLRLTLNPDGSMTMDNGDLPIATQLMVLQTAILEIQASLIEARVLDTIMTMGRMQRAMQKPRG